MGGDVHTNGIRPAGNDALRAASHAAVLSAALAVSGVNGRLPASSASADASRVLPSRQEPRWPDRRPGAQGGADLDQEETQQEKEEGRLLLREHRNARMRFWQGARRSC